MKRILFIDSTDTIARKYEDRFYPFWPSYLTSYLKKHLGSELFEFRVLTKTIEKELESYKPHMVAISSVSRNFNFAKDYARIAKSYNLPVVIGGCHISALPQCLTSDMNVGCIGEGEQTFLEIMKHFIENDGLNPANLGEINGIVYRINGKLIKTPARPAIKQIDTIPHPDRSLQGYLRYDTMQTARGCPYRCVFCSVSRYWGKVRYFSTDYVMEEIRELIDNGVKFIRIYDDLFTGNKKRLFEIVDEIVKNGFQKKVSFWCWVRASNVTPEVVAALKRMNVVAVEMGLESGSDRTLKYLKGSGTVEENWRAIQLFKEAGGIQTNGDFIIGSPEETSEEIMQTYDFIKNSRVDVTTVSTLRPLPGTPIWEYALKKGLVSNDMDWSKINDTILSETLSRDEILVINSKFKRLRFRKRFKALFNSPWLSELPKVGTKRLVGRILRISQSLMAKAK